MSVSDRARRGLIPLLIALTTSCDDPGASLLPPETPPELVVVAALDPGSAFQTAFVQAVGGGPPPRPVVARVLRDGVMVAEETIDEVTHGDPGACASGFGSRITGGGVCVQLPLWPEVGAEYEIQVQAPGRRRAWARTTVVGTFDLHGAAVAGEPPEHVTASWSASPGAHRYFLSVRAAEASCLPCATGWATYLDSTRYDGAVDRASLTEGRRPWLVQVQAMNRDFYDFLTTGATGHVFTVPPRQNVVDGYGVFGSRARSQVQAGKLVADLRRGPWELRSLPGPDLQTLRIDPSAPDVLWVASAAEVLRSEDAGKSWTKEFDGPGLSPTTLSLGPGGTVLIARGGEVLWREPDGGGWAVAATFDHPVRATLQAAGVAWAMTAEAGGAVTHVHRAETGNNPAAPAGAWREIGAVDLAPRNPRDRARLVGDPASATLWMGLREGAPLFRSDDEGATWQRLTAPPGLLEDLVAVPGGPLYAGIRGASDAIMVSRDGGSRWTITAEIPTAALAAHPDRPDRVWIGEQVLPRDPHDRPRLRVVRSTAAGADAEPTGFAGGDPRDLVVDPTGRWVYLLVGVASFDLPGLSTTAVLRLSTD